MKRGVGVALVLLALYTVANGMLNLMRFEAASEIVSLCWLLVARVCVARLIDDHRTHTRWCHAADFLNVEAGTLFGYDDSETSIPGTCGYSLLRARASQWDRAQIRGDAA